MEWRGGQEFPMRRIYGGKGWEGELIGIPLCSGFAYNELHRMVIHFCLLVYVHVVFRFASVNGQEIWTSLKSWPSALSLCATNRRTM